MCLKYSRILFLVGLISGCAITTPEPDNEPLLPSDLVVMTYNIHHGAGRDGVIDLERIAAVIASAGPDLVALQEVDRGVERSGRVDQATRLAELTGMEMRFGFAITYQGGDFGNVILSKHPIHELELHALPGEPGEDRVLMEATILFEVEGQPQDTLSFLATHLDTFTEPRRASIPLINAVVEGLPERLIVLAGDLNAGKQSPTITGLTDKLMHPDSDISLNTFPSSNPDRQIDYVLHSVHPNWVFQQASVLDAPIASDHAPLVLTFRYNP